ncbi:MAG TPA: diadenylate cyclase CdaA [Anaerolineae bacterium]|nr:diadenylate cyclase CdaA [Anaerolineae bacterium]MCB9103481.1 TIGR00159 family protein [Anaerolineales bacterium]HRV92400.1 diadenylate cyclase CdaA [Anaerolineae bacterium]
MDSITLLYNQALFLLSNLSWLNIIDLVLVTLAFFVLLSVIRQSTFYLFRETLAVAVILLLVTIVLPLPAFDWLAQGILVAILVATPIIFQNQLRRFFEQVARTIGLAQAVQQGTAENYFPQLIHAVENMAASKTGALVVIEGNDSLDEIIKTGIRCNAQVTSEMLQTIFFPKTPLHDGAVIIRIDRIAAAGCVLPLTQQTLEADKRLGTRHRAAVGVSEAYDAMVVVVSEETGQISAARAGVLNRPLTSAQLREELTDFFDPATHASPSLSLRSLLRQGVRKLWHSITQSSAKQLLINSVFLLISFALALIVWGFAFDQTHNIMRVRVPDIPLRVEGLPPDTQIISSPPSTVSAIVQTTEDQSSTLTSNSFQAVASLQGMGPGVHRVPIRVSSSIPQVLVLEPDPETVDLELAPIITRSLPINVNLDQQGFPAAYQVSGPAVTFPMTATVNGPEPLVDQINQVQARVSLDGVTSSVRERYALEAVDSEGQPIPEIKLDPTEVQVNVPIRQRVDARTVSVRAIPNGTPPAGYWLSDLSVTPASVTLQGDSSQLDQVGSYVDTLPVDISQAAGDLKSQVPLDLPAGVQAIDSEGRRIETVDVVARIAARQGDLAVTRPVEILPTTSEITATVSPAQVDLLLSGPLPTLNEIEANPELVRVSLEATDLGQGNTEVFPTVTKPKNVDVQLIPETVLVRVAP